MKKLMSLTAIVIALFSAQVFASAIGAEARASAEALRTIQDVQNTVETRDKTLKTWIKNDLRDHQQRLTGIIKPHIFETVKQSFDIYEAAKDKELEALNLFMEITKLDPTTAKAQLLTVYFTNKFGAFTPETLTMLGKEVVQANKSYRELDTVFRQLVQGAQQEYMDQQARLLLSKPHP